MNQYIKASATAIVIIFAFLGLSCGRGQSENDSDENKVFDFCLVSRVYTAGRDTGQLSMKYLYDSQDRLIYWDHPGGTLNDVMYRYEPGKVTVSMPDRNSYTIYYLRADSTTYASSTYRQGQREDSLDYYYNGNKNLIKTVRFTNAFGIDSSVRIYSNGNVTKQIFYGPNGSSELNLEYTTIPSKSWLYDQYGVFVNGTPYLPWLGRPNKNLISKTRDGGSGGFVSETTFNYELNASGYVKSITSNSSGSSEKQVYEYQCR